MIDKIRGELSQITERDQKFRDLMMDSLPQFVVVGAQSSGKSSVLKRISNNSIKLPEAASVCTKVPTMLVLRRAGAGVDAATAVALKGPDGFCESVPLAASGPRADAVRAAVAEAQRLAMERSPGQTFAAD